MCLLTSTFLLSSPGTFGGFQKCWVFFQSKSIIGNNSTWIVRLNCKKNIFPGVFYSNMNKSIYKKDNQTIDTGSHEPLVSITRSLKFFSF